VPSGSSFSSMAKAGGESSRCDEWDANLNEILSHLVLRAGRNEFGPDASARAWETAAGQAPRRWLAINTAIVTPTAAWAQPSAGRTVSLAK
jgi:hypothetical protein